MGVMGIDIGGTNIRVGFVEEGKLGKIESSIVRKNGTKDEILDALHLLIEKFKKEKIEGIGVGVPSVVDVEKGIVYDVQNIPSWNEVHLKKILEAKNNVPVYINNDANCFVVGEKYFGKGKNYKNIVGLIVGTGLGAGLIMNDRLYSGNNCGAGEFGMIPFKESNYEYYCSGQYFQNEHRLTGEDLCTKASRGDLAAFKIFSIFGANLGEAIKTIMFAVDPEIIVLGGSVSKSFEFYKNDMWNSIKSFAYSKSVSKIKIEVSTSSNIAILGAASLYYDAVGIAER
jgi:glucokinase